MGAHHVTRVRFSDEAIERIHSTTAPWTSSRMVPGWLAELNNSMARNGAAVLTIDSDDPEAMSGIDPRKLIARAQASHKACKEFYDALDFGRCVWCIVGGASPAWAAKVFPDRPEDEAVERLWKPSSPPSA